MDTMGNTVYKALLFSYKDSKRQLTCFFVRNVYVEVASTVRFVAERWMITTHEIMPNTHTNTIQVGPKNQLEMDL